MTKSLQDKVIIVTGAGRGIGREIALLCAAEGAKVVVNDPGGASDGSGSSAAPAEEVVEEIKKRGGTAVANFETVAEAIPASRIVKTATDHFGKLDGVVNNAGILRDMIFHRMSVEAFEAVIKVHLMGSFYVSHAAARLFREQESGSFVHFTSTSGLIGNFGQANYAARARFVNDERPAAPGRLAVDRLFQGAIPNPSPPLPTASLRRTRPLAKSTSAMALRPVSAA